MITDLSRLSFGALAAERERSALGALFVPSVAYDRFAQNRRIIALGNRGSGKTALLSMMADVGRDEGRAVIELMPEDYGYELLRESVRSEAAGAWHKQGAYAAAWKYLLYVLAMREVTKSPGLKTGPEKRIYTYLRDHQAGAETNPVGMLISFLKRLEGVKFGKYEAAIKAKELHRLYALDELSALLDDLNEVCAPHGLTFVVDELDRGWDASEDAVAFVAGLFQAATSIASRTPNLRVVMSLRRELYDNIPSLYEDAQKVRDTIEILQWTPESLFTLICRRIRHSLDLPPTLSNEHCWSLVFPGSFRGLPSYDALVGMTLLRPRELIHLCSEALTIAREQQSDLPISPDALETAIAVFSKDRFQDIVAEYRFQFPGLASVFETFRGLSWSWTRADLELHLLSIGVEEIRVGGEAEWARRLDADRLIEVLWQIGFLMALTPAAADRATTYAGPQHVRTLNLRNVKEFRLHPMFASYLGVLPDGDFA